jgi:hypothetical protein
MKQPRRGMVAKRDRAHDCRRCFGPEVRLLTFVVAQCIIPNRTADEKGVAEVLQACAISASQAGRQQRRMVYGA